MGALGEVKLQMLECGFPDVWVNFFESWRPDFRKYMVWKLHTVAKINISPGSIVTIPYFHAVLWLIPGREQVWNKNMNTWVIIKFTKTIQMPERSNKNQDNMCAAPVCPEEAIAGTDSAHCVLAAFT